MGNRVCVYSSICFMCVCAYLAASVCANACLSMGVSVWPASRLLAIMSSTVVVKGILVIARVPQASAPRCITDRRVTQPKWQRLLHWHFSFWGESHRRISAVHTVKYGLHLFIMTIRTGYPAFLFESSFYSGVLQIPCLLFPNLSLKFFAFMTSSNTLCIFS